MGLFRIFLFSLTFGISISFAYILGGNTPESDFSFLSFDLVSRALGTSGQSLFFVTSLAIGIYSIFSMAKIFRQIIENKVLGVIVSLLGFFGSILILTSPQITFQIALIGVGFWIIGLVLVITNMNKTKIKI